MLNLCLLPTALRQQPRQTPVFLLPLIFLSYNGCIQQAWSFFIFFFVYFFPLLFLAIPSGVYIPWWREDITFVLFFFICMCWNTEQDSSFVYYWGALYVELGVEQINDIIGYWGHER